MSHHRSIIITGDDFGSSPQVNRAIIQAHEQGVLTGASLMVTGEAWEEAVALAKAHPQLAVGLHLVLSSGRSVLPPDQIPALVDESGRFSSDLVRVGFRYQMNHRARTQVKREIQAQLEKFHQTGLRLSHVDGHQQMHLPPIVLKTLIELSEEFGIKAIRLPSEELRLTLRLDRSGWVEKVKLSLLFGLLRVGYAKRLLQEAGMNCAERVYGLLQTGRMTEEYLLGLIPQIRADRVEIYSHPIVEGADRFLIDPLGAHPAQLAALLSRRVRSALDSNGFRLGTYGEMN